MDPQANLSDSLLSFGESLSYKEQLALEKELANRSAAHLAILASAGKWKPTPHLRLLDNLLSMVEVRTIDRLLVTLGPRHGKSELISKYFQSYYVGKHPDHRMILASYEHEFAAEWGRKARDILEDHGDRFYGVKIRQDSKAADRWGLEGREGGMQTCGVGGPLTGKGSDILTIDDPFKNAEEANSELIREKKWDWFRTAAYTRLEPEGAIILVATRWHEADITGRILSEMKEGGEQWTLLHLPSLHESTSVDATITIPSATAKKLGIGHGRKFATLNSYLQHVAA